MTNFYHNRFSRFLSFIILLNIVGCSWLNNPSLNGVLVGDDIPKSVKDYIRWSGVVDTNQEEILAYFDATLTLDNSESYILTNKKLVIYCDGEAPFVETLDCLGTDPHPTTVIPFSEIVDVYKSEIYYDGTKCSFFLGPCFYVSTLYGEYFLGFGPGMGANLFIDVLIEEVGL